MNSPSNKKRYLPILWLACAIEAFFTIIYILLLPSDPKNVVFAGYSVARIITIVFLLGVILIMVWMAYLIHKRTGRRKIIISMARLERAEGGLFLISLLVLIICLFLLVLTPPSIRGARIERLAPILVWLGLCSLQIAVALIVFCRQKIALRLSTLSDLLKRGYRDQQTGYWLLFLSLLIGLVTIFYTYYNYWDEGDTYSVGWLLSKGYILYRDVFSHHFPLSYMWIGLISALFGPSITLYRISLLLLRVGLFIVSMRLSGYTMLIGLTSLVWSLIGPMYLGNMLLFYSFDGIFIVSSVFVILAILNKEVSFSIKHSVFVGILISLAVLTDPIMTLPGAVIAIFIAISGFQQEGGLKQKIIYTLSPFLAVGVVILLYTGYLVITSSFSYFISDAILFNTQVYNRYAGQAFSISGLVNGMISSLNIFDPNIRIYYSPYFNWEYYTGLANWIFTALFFRLSIIICSLILLLRKKYMGCGLFFLLGSVLFYRGISDFHGSPFIFLAVAGSVYSVINGVLITYSFFKNERVSQLINKLKNSIIIVMTVLISFMFVILSFRMGDYWIKNLSELSYNKQFGHIDNDSGYLRQFTCGYENASLLVYPINPGMYFFAKLAPATPYLFMTPWVAEIAEQKVIDELKEKAAVVYIDKNTDIWGYPVRIYLTNLISFLDKEYLEVDTNVYISPILDQYCKLNK